MRKRLLLFVLTFVALTFSIKAQAPQGFNYQAIARDSVTGKPLSDKNLKVQITLHQNSATGTAAYQESHTLTTNKFGLINLVVGSGTPSISTFSLIPWGTFSYFIEVGIDTTPAFSGPYISMGSQQLMSVPYAIYSGNGGGSTDSQTLSIIGNTLTISNGNSISLPTQTLTISGNSLSISNGNSVTLPIAVSDRTLTIVGLGSATVTGTYPDFTITTPVSIASQTLSLTGNTLSISNGNSVALPASVSDQTVTIASGGVATVTGTYPNFTVTAIETQTLSLSGNILSIANGNSIVLPTSVSDRTVTITAAGSATVTGTYPDFTITTPVSIDSQTLTIVGNVISISNGNNITLPSAIETQTLSISGNTLFISNGNSVALPASVSDKTVTITAAGSATVTGTYPDFTITTPASIDSQTLSINGYTLTIANGNSIVLPTSVSDRTVTITAAGSATVTGTYPDFTITTPASIDSQTLSINGYTLTIANGNTVALPIQTLTLTGSTISISDGNSITLPLGVDSQTLSINGYTLTIANGNSVSLPQSVSDRTLTIVGLGSATVTGTYPDFTIITPASIDSQTLSLIGNSLSISNGNTVIFPTPVETQTLSINGYTLTIANGNSVILPQGVSSQTVTIVGGGINSVTGSYPNFTITAIETQSLSLAGNILSISNGNSIALPTFISDQTVTISGAGTASVTVIGTYPNFTITATDKDSQTLSINGYTLTIANGNSVTLPQSVSGQTVTLAGGGINTVTGTYPNFTVTAIETQTLSISGNTLFISNGNSVALPASVSDRTVTITAAGSATVTGTYPDFTISTPASIDSQTLTIVGNVISISNGNNITLPSAIESQTLSINGYTLTIANGNSVTLPQSVSDKTISIAGGGINTVTGTYPNYTLTAVETQSLSINGYSLTISNGNSVTLPNAVSDRTVTIVGLGSTTVTGTYPDFTITTPVSIESQTLSINGYTLTIANGNSVTLPQSVSDRTVTITGYGAATVAGIYPSFSITAVDTDAQNLVVNGYSLTIANGNTVALPTQSLSVAGNIISISNGNNITLPTAVESQTLSINGYTLTISNGNSIILPQGVSGQTVTITGAGSATVTGTYPDFTITTPASVDSQTLSINGYTLTIANGNSVVIPASLSDRTVTITGYGAATVNGTYPSFSVTATDTQTLTINGYTLSIADGNTVHLPIQTLSVSGTDISLSGANTVPLPSYTLAINGYTLSISNGNTITLPVGNNYWTQSGGNLYPTVLTDNVGIGVITPSVTLHIFNNNTSTLRGIISDQMSNDANGAQFSLRKRRQDGPLLLDNILGEINFTGHDGANYKRTARIFSGASEPWSIGQNGTYMGFETTPNGTSVPAERMRISNSGNVGIGIITPTVTLQVNGEIGLGDGGETGNRSVVIWLKNYSASAIPANSIVIIDGNNAHPNGITTTNLSGHTAAAGVTIDEIPPGSSGKVAISGVAKVMADVTTIPGQHVITGSIIAGRAGSVATPNAGASIGLWLENVAVGSMGKVLLR